MAGRSTSDRQMQLAVMAIVGVLLLGAIGLEVQQRRSGESEFVVLDTGSQDPVPRAAPLSVAPESTVVTTAEDAQTPAETTAEPAIEFSCADAAVTASEGPAVADGQRALAITELHYHPADGPEFIEVSNVGSAPVDLAGWSIDGVEHCWVDEQVVGVGGRVVVTEGIFPGRLDNGGERVALVDPDGRTVDLVEFDDRELWPADADGDGRSLHRIDPTAPGANPGNWISSAPGPGGPTLHRYGVLPVWRNVEHTVLPESGSSVTVTAELTGVSAARAEIAYRVGFDAEQRIPVELGSDGSIRASLPGQPAGTLIRYRLIATSSDGATGTWPRQGDGATYTGTTVSSGDDELQRIQWFMEDAEYRTAFDDLSLSNNGSYPAVIAVDGVVFDAARIRLKGRSSLGFPKPKWKVDLPAGHRLQIPGLIDHAVDEFALHAAYNDKSFMREVLAQEAFAAAGLPVLQAFPIRLDRNGEFDGLYIYVEQADGRWRSRIGLDDAIVYDVGAAVDAVLDPSELADDALPLGQRYDREAGASDDELRRLIEDLASVSADVVDPAARRAWFGERIDIASVLNTLATSAVIQHQDFRSKNYRLAFVDGRWSMLPYDLELTWGRGFDAACMSICDAVEIDDVFVVANTNLTRPFLDDPVLSSMLRRRIVTLRDELLDVDRLAAEVEEFIAVTSEAAGRDRDVWGTHGEPQPADVAARELIENFVVPQRERLSGPDAPLQLGALDPVVDLSAAVVITATDDGWVLANAGDQTVDASGAPLDDGLVVPGGVVLPAGGSAELTVTDGSAEVSVVAWAL